MPAMHALKALAWISVMSRVLCQASCTTLSRNGLGKLASSVMSPPRSDAVEVGPASVLNQLRAFGVRQRLCVIVMVQTHDPLARELERDRVEFLLAEPRTRPKSAHGEQSIARVVVRESLQGRQELAAAIRRDSVVRGCSFRRSVFIRERSFP